ncbi:MULTISPECIES: hypothetical protein [unclassified Flavobacterium]|uniref:hypothetical protein n=1 Tax=unclassified Flavobacterium TaxID=196869 RepID=UPI0025BB10F6|nr:MULTISPECIES: hypothetical protein [unclassified Flavobacterium]
MKKFKMLFMFMLMITATMSFGQAIKSVAVGGGISYFNKTESYPAVTGFNLNATVNRFYVSFANAQLGTVTGGGVYTGRYAYDDVITLFSAGYVFPSTDKFSVTPTIGTGKAAGVSKINVGAVATYKLGKIINLFAGAGTFELFKAGVSIQFYNKNKG